ncbi:MAG: hypothetical protein UY44_C0010G0009 [Candidatus Kaiserbacteria bacterium GW2011_GWA2_49_19]|uniref:Uncharacterized protein n=1 Tax=Candidatus Kaiserbacteria bacterium GW2011_GWA2_49_19 TaxID=1618669 RepID=A0A0G1Y0N7_9BACT|nr:MAG: hypothetical protein UY44_C0010G0009 [Candidatus Kaiserbacteria bacterium GW2011_GWA2_49_19]
MTLKEHDEWKEDNHGQEHARAKTHRANKRPDSDDTDTYRKRRDEEEQNKKQKERQELF